jgi:hypothetical protein
VSPDSEKSQGFFVSDCLSFEFSGPRVFKSFKGFKTAFNAPIYAAVGATGGRPCLYILTGGQFRSKREKLRLKSSYKPPFLLNLNPPLFVANRFN